MRFKYHNKVRVNKGFYEGQIVTIYGFWKSGLFKKKTYYMVCNNVVDEYFLEEDLDILED